MASLDIDTAKYLAEQSKDMVNRQVDTYREKRSTSSTLIGLNTLFIPFFVAGLNDSAIWLKAVAALPILLISLALYFLLKIYYLRPLEQGLAISRYDETINKSYSNALLMEIAVNRDSFNTNMAVLDNLNKSYRLGIFLTKSAIGISIVLLTLNMFLRPEAGSIKVEITNPTINEQAAKP